MCCHAELFSASHQKDFELPGEILKQVQDDKKLNTALSPPENLLTLHL